jgi:hypothetical protein
MVKRGRLNADAKGDRRGPHKGGSLSTGRIATVGSVLESYISQHPEFQYQVKIREALVAWPKISDEYTAHHTEAVMVKDRILYVNTDSSALASELTLRGSELLKRLNRELGTPLLKRILFKSGRVARRDGAKREEKEEGEGGHREKALSTEEEKGLRWGVAGSRLTARTLKRIDSTVRVIHEEELREILKRFLRVTAQRNREDRQG